MNVEKINSNQINHRGIKLSSNNEKVAKRINSYLRINGFDCVGKKTYVVNNTFKDKQEKANYIREHYQFDNDEYGFVFFPWSREAYIMSEPAYEQKLIEWVREMDKKASINLII